MKGLSTYLNALNAFKMKSYKIHTEPNCFLLENINKCVSKQYAKLKKPYGSFSLQSQNGLVLA